MQHRNDCKCVTVDGSMAAEAARMFFMYLLYCPCPDVECAKALAYSLVALNPAVFCCCNIIPQVTSIFLWNGQIQESSEVLLVVKTLITEPEVLIQHIKQNHPYDTPLVACWPAETNF